MFMQYLCRFFVSNLPSKAAKHIPPGFGIILYNFTAEEVLNCTIPSAHVALLRKNWPESCHYWLDE